MNHDDVLALAVRYFSAVGYETRTQNHKNTNGPDLTLIGAEDVWRVEVLTTRVTSAGSIQTCAVQANRLNDDFVFIGLGHSRFQILPMSDYRALMMADGSMIMTPLARLLSNSRPRPKRRTVELTAANSAPAP